MLLNTKAPRRSILLNRCLATGKLHFLGAALIAVVCLAAGVTTLAALPASAATTSPTRSATTWTSYTDCNGGTPLTTRPYVTVCLHAGIWFTGTSAGSNWQWHSCTVSLWASPWYSCVSDPHGVYWNQSIGAN